MSSPNQFFGQLLLSDQELKEFDNVYNGVLNEFIKSNLDKLDSTMEQENEWAKIVFEKNVTPLDHLRGFMICAAYKSLLMEEITAEGLHHALVLGCLMEISHGSSIIVENIMDEKKSMSFNYYHHQEQESCNHHLSPAWHKCKHVGMTAINDSVLLRIAGYYILKTCLGQHAQYNQFENICRIAYQNAVWGRVLVEHMKKTKNEAESYTMQQYRLAIQYTKCYISFTTPVLLALALAEKSKDLELVSVLKELMSEVGYYYQLCIDYSEIFQRDGNNDENLEKLSWLFVRSIEKYKETDNYEKIKHLVDHIEKGDLENVKKIYLDLGILQEYEKERTLTYQKILNQIEKLPEPLADKVASNFVLKLVNIFTVLYAAS